MEYLNNRLVKSEDLEKAVNLDGQRIYSENLIQQIKSGNFNYLNQINLKDRNNKYFMEPLLFAVRNSEFSTYEVYKYYGEELQEQDLTIATEIVINEPKVMEDTAIANNPTLVLQLAKINPEIILYMSEDLKSDGEFIQELCEEGGREAIGYVVQECNVHEVLQDNPELVSNHEFMKEAIKEDINIIQYLDKDLRDNYNFIKEIADENREVIDYVAEHVEEFGKEALTATRDSLEKHFIDDATRAVQEERTIIEEEKIKTEDKEENEEALKKSQKQEHDLETIMSAVEKFQMLSPEKKPSVAHKYLVYVKNMPEHFRKELEKYDRIYLAEKEKSKSDKKITPKRIEAVAEKAQLSEIQAETSAIREEITVERAMDREQTEESEEIGE